MKKTVLLVEDERDTRELLARAVERAGYECPTAADRATALEEVAKLDRLDLVVTDVVLGADDRGGLHLLREMRAAGRRVPVIVITAYADVEKVKLALNGGAAHLIEKSFRASELLLVIDEVLERAGRGGANGPHAPAASAILDVLASARLTAKERTVALLLLEGLSSIEIAARESNSPKTIRQHVSQIYAKCGVSTRAELFRLAYAR